MIASINIKRNNGLQKNDVVQIKAVMCTLHFMSQIWPHSSYIYIKLNFAWITKGLAPFSRSFIVAKKLNLDLKMNYKNNKNMYGFITTKKVYINLVLSANEKSAQMRM